MIAKKTNKGWRVIVILSLCANLCIAAVFLYKFGIGIIHKIDNLTNGGATITPMCITMPILAPFC